MIHELPATAFTPRTRTPWLLGDDSQSKRHELLTYFQQTYDLYDSLFEALAVEEAWFNKAIPLRHPLIFYFGHTAAFFINKLLAGGWIDARLDARTLGPNCPMTQEAKKLLRDASEAMGFSNRAYTRVVKVARTIADLAGGGEISEAHIAEAVQYRALDRKYWH